MMITEEKLKNKYIKYLSLKDPLICFLAMENLKSCYFQHLTYIIHIYYLKGNARDTFL